MKLDDEVRIREEAEQTLRSYRKDVDDAAAARLDLERRVDSLMDEISFLKKVHDEEIQELSSLMEAQQVTEFSVVDKSRLKAHFHWSLMRWRRYNKSEALLKIQGPQVVDSTGASIHTEFKAHMVNSVVLEQCGSGQYKFIPKRV